MLTEETIIFEYEEILLGNKKNYVYCFEGTPEETRRELGIIWKYAIENLLHWTPQAAVAYMTQDIAESLQLTKTYPYLDFDYDVKEIFDFRYILQFAYPGIIKYSLHEETISEYEHVLKIGRWSKDMNPHKFPKNYFLDSKVGMKRAAIVLNYAIHSYLGEMTIPDLYDFFGDAKKSMRWLTEKKLSMNAKILYEQPLDYFHYSLSKDARDDFLYHNALFNERYKNERKRKR